MITLDSVLQARSVSLEHDIVSPVKMELSPVISNVSLVLSAFIATILI